MIRSPASVLIVGALLALAGRAAGQGARSLASTQPTPRGGKVVVVTMGLRSESPEHARFANVARRLGEFHRAKVMTADPANLAALGSELAAAKPDDVIIVVPPEILDLNLHRAFLRLACALDADPFPDFAFGWFTARDGAAVESLCDRTLALHRSGLRNHIWASTAVTSGMKSAVYRDSRSALEKAAGFTGNSWYFGILEKDPEVMAFIDAALPEVQKASIVEVSGNGDPEGIWLFSDRRNMDRARHWPFDPARVGQDPDHTMPRLMASKVARLNLGGAIVWSGTCHSAATRRVFVEGDIVSTFGRAEGVPVYELKPAESLALAWIDGGATALIAPIGPNHGLAVMRETQFALREGASLGDAVKSTWDSVILANDGHLDLDVFKEGKIERHGEKVMAGGGVNRLLIGDPTLAPFTRTPDPSESTTITADPDGGLRVTIDWQKGFHAGGWNMYGGDRDHDACVTVRMPLDGSATTTAAMPKVTLLRATDEHDAPLPFAVAFVLGEVVRGRRFLHVQINASRKVVDNHAWHLTLGVR